MENDRFIISFEFDSKPVTGWIHPSGNLNDSGRPVSFHVVLNDVTFGDLSFEDCKWVISEERPADLVKLIGKQIENHYKF